MKITATPIVGAWHIEATPFVDERGSFSRTFARKPLVTRVWKPSLSSAICRGTVPKPRCADYICKRANMPK
ncbi:hypothetical protein ACFFW8_20140 [Erwinia tracheiphila]